MNIENPEESLDIIYSQLSKTEIFKGYRPADLTGVSLFSGLFAFLQPLLHLPGTYLFQWMIAGGLICLYVFGRIFIGFFSLESKYEKRKVKVILFQFFPSLLAGLIIFIFLGDTPGVSPVLPGLLCLLFGLGISGMIPHLTRELIFVVLIYFLGGMFLLAYSHSEPLVVFRLFGGIFAVGHLCSAYIIRWYINE